MADEQGSSASAAEAANLKSAQELADLERLSQAYQPDVTVRCHFSDI